MSLSHNIKTWMILEMSMENPPEYMGELAESAMGAFPNAEMDDEDLFFELAFDVFEELGSEDGFPVYNEDETIGTGFWG